jgi:hypothetical protein
VTRKTKTRKAHLPAFRGFYQTHWEQLLGDIEELYAGMHAEEERAEGGLDQDEIAELLSETSSVSRLCIGIAKRFCQGFDTEMSQKLGFRLGLKFARLDSPSEYNFTTDRIVAGMPLGTAERLFALSERDGHERLGKAIREAFTPHPGFVPYYSNRAGDWTAKPVAAWDSVELGVLLDAFVDTDIDSDLYHDIAEGGAYEAFEDCVDWKRFEEKADALRREKTDEYLEEVEFEGKAS